MRSRLERDGRWSGELWQQRKDGQEFLCSVQASVVLDATGQRSHYVAVLGDITDQKRAEQELRYLANYDTLTSLPNRALLSERLSRAIVAPPRHGDRPAHPRAAGGAAGAPNGARPPPRQSHRDAVPRPGPLQGHQRLARP